MIGFETFYVLSAIINGAVAMFNGYKSRAQQDRHTLIKQEITKDIEANKQNFQLEVNEQNEKVQRELALLGHKLRIQEQHDHFEILCKQAEWNRFMNSWPLMNVPSVIRSEQILPDDTISLRIFFTRNNDTVFSKYVYPLIEQGLREFVDLYHNEFGSKNIIFYHNSFVGNVTGGAIETNLHYALSDLPVIVVDANVLPREICVHLTMWGMGGISKEHFTVFKIPYQAKDIREAADIDYYEKIADRLLAYIKYIVGYTYDLYNLIYYNRLPLLLKIAEFENATKSSGSIVSYPELLDDISKTYVNIYRSVLKPDNCLVNSKCLIHDSYKESLLHWLRLKYAQAVKGYVDKEKYIQYLEDAVEAWISLRSLESTEVFLNKILTDAVPLERYFSKEDVDFFLSFERELADDISLCKHGDLLSDLLNKLHLLSEKLIINTNISQKYDDGVRLLWDPRSLLKSRQYVDSGVMHDLSEYMAANALQSSSLVYIYRQIANEIPENRYVNRNAFDNIVDKYWQLNAYKNAHVAELVDDERVCKFPIITLEWICSAVSGQIKNNTCDSNRPVEALIYLQELNNAGSAYKYLGGMRLFDEHNVKLEKYGYDFLCLCVSLDIADEIKKNGNVVIIRCKI